MGQDLMGQEKRTMLPMKNHSQSRLPTGETRTQRLSAIMKGQADQALLSRGQLGFPHLVRTKLDVVCALELIRRCQSHDAAD